LSTLLVCLFVWLLDCLIVCLTVMVPSLADAGWWLVGCGGLGAMGWLAGWRERDTRKFGPHRKKDVVVKTLKQHCPVSDTSQF
jgi:hypothetical protein